MGGVCDCVSKFFKPVGTPVAKDATGSTKSGCQDSLEGAVMVGRN